MRSKRIITITTGDLNSVGLEVTMKALPTFANSKGTFILMRGKSTGRVCWRALPKQKTLTLTSVDDALTEAHSFKSPYKFIEVLSEDSPADWVNSSARLCLSGAISGLVTGPISKGTFMDAGFESIGHTPLLKKVCKAKEAYMGFLGKFFNVILLSGHIPVSEIERSLTSRALKIGFETISQWLNGLPQSVKKKPIGVLGLNPHSGENGLIGTFEQRLLNVQLSEKRSFVGPLVPDAAFAKENWKKYSFFLALYHDQGLIPFKMIHGHSGGAHVTVGLPIIRTSVAHGTAIDIFGKGIARPESMIDAIRWCEILIDKKG